MNLKNSKFYRRIQILKRLSKERLRSAKCCTRVNCRLKNIFREPCGFVEPNEVCDAANKAESCNGSDSSIESEKSKKEEMCDESLKLKQRNFILKHKRNSCIVPFPKVQKVNGTKLIRYNNTCFRIKIPTAENFLNKIQRSDSMPSIRSAGGSICVKYSRYVMIGKIAKYLGYKLVKEDKLWNILWTDSLPGVDVYKNMKRFQQINHFPGMMEICRKDLLSRNLNRMLKLYPKDYKIFPKTWVFPADYGEAANYAAKNPKTFILKPDAGARGRGIWLTNDIKRINPTERMICQTYISKPLLIDGYKFDLRLYVVITSIDPLRIFVFNEGLARFATNKYIEPAPDNKDDLYMHLTNYSLNRRNSQYDLCDNDDCGSKRKFSAINKWMRRRNHDTDEFWGRIDDIIIKTVLSAWPMLKHNYHACFPGHDKIHACFEILGFDILVDASMRPYLLEVNHSPSFHTHEMVDRQVKKPLIRDTLLLVSTALADKRKIMREDRKRIKQRLLKVRKGTRSLLPAKMRLSNSSVLDSPRRLKKECPLSPLAQQIAWEESHLGDFRRVMPPHDPTKLNYYCQFYSQNQSSIFANTAASKKREEQARKMRKELEAKRRLQNEIKDRPPAVKFDERCRKRSAIPRVIVERHRKTQLRNQEHWTPGFISIAEERLRLSNLNMRNELIKDLQLTETIYSHLYHAGNLSKTDINKFPHLYKYLESGGDITVKI